MYKRPWFRKRKRRRQKAAAEKHVAELEKHVKPKKSVAQQVERIKAAMEQELLMDDLLDDEL